NTRVIDMHTIKPLDIESVLKAAKDCGAIVTAENHSIINGLGSAVAEVLAENRIGIPFKRVGIKDRFGTGGFRPLLDEEMEISPSNIVKAVKSTIGFI
ncbi:MAG: transketolase family protein, partial [Candidatus Moranbacteria bacterium]|nr:transketolase family protein [Candidatus Moranbacteria bacterium]